MTNQHQSISTVEVQAIEKKHTDHKRLTQKVLRLGALANNNFDRKDFNLEESIANIESNIKTLGASDELQEMLAAQMLSVHRLQQLSMSLASSAPDGSNKQYFTNVGIKLANCFIQQANLLSKLQGHSSQRMVVEHVTIHSGAQAIVGNINRGTPVSEVKK